MGESMMRNLAAMLGLIALGVAIVIGTWAAFGTLGKKAPTGSSVASVEATPEQTKQGGQTTAGASVGQTVTTGSVSWTITDAEQETEISRFTIPPHTEHGDFVVLTFSVKNVSELPVTLDSDQVTLVDSEGNEFRAVADRNSAYVVPERDILFNEQGLLKPGESKEGEVNFEVLPTSSGFQAYLLDTAPHGSKGESVDLGF
jgi:uncharacterized cupredoxin-like copper-binding protein